LPRVPSAPIFGLRHLSSFVSPDISAALASGYSRMLFADASFEYHAETQAYRVNGSNFGAALFQRVCPGIAALSIWALAAGNRLGEELLFGLDASS